MVQKYSLQLEQLRQLNQFSNTVGAKRFQLNQCVHRPHHWKSWVMHQTYVLGQSDLQQVCLERHGHVKKNINIYYYESASRGQNCYIMSKSIKFSKMAHNYEQKKKAKSNMFFAMEMENVISYFLRCEYF